MITVKTDQRAAIYKLLSECYRSPDESLIPLVNELQQVMDGYDLGKTEKLDIAEIFSKENIEELKVEHARLFVGPFTLLAPPYGSMYMESAEQLMTESAMNVLRWYEAEGMDVALLDMPDHIRVELEFMYLLSFRESKTVEGNGIAGNERTDVLALRKKQRDFLLQHLGRWISEFEKKVIENSKSDFYNELASLTASFIQRDVADLTEAIK